MYIPPGLPKPKVGGQQKPGGFTTAPGGWRPGAGSQRPGGLYGPKGGPSTAPRPGTIGNPSLTGSPFPGTFTSPAQHDPQAWQGQNYELSNMLGKLDPMLTNPMQGLQGFWNMGGNPKYRGTPMSNNPYVQDYMSGQQSAGVNQVRNLAQQMQGGLANMSRRGMGLAGGVDPRSAMMAQGMQQVAQGAADRFGQGMQWGAGDADRFNQFQLQKAGLANQALGTYGGMYGNALGAMSDILGHRKDYAQMNQERARFERDYADNQWKRNLERKVGREQAAFNQQKQMEDWSNQRALQENLRRSFAGAYSGSNAYQMAMNPSPGTDLAQMYMMQQGFKDPFKSAGGGGGSAGKLSGSGGLYGNRYKDEMGRQI